MRHIDYDFWVFLLLVGSFLITLGIPELGCLQVLHRDTLLHSYLLALLHSFACLRLRPLALFCALLYPTAFRATMVGSCTSQLSFFAYNCFRQFFTGRLFACIWSFWLTMGKCVWAPQQTISKKALGLENAAKMRPPNSKKNWLVLTPRNAGYSGLFVLHRPSEVLEFLELFVKGRAGLRGISWGFWALVIHNFQIFKRFFLQWPSEGVWSSRVFVQWPSKLTEFPMFSLMM